MQVLRLPLPQVSQRQLADLYSGQKSLVAAFLCWRKTVFEACRVFSESNPASDYLRPLYLQSLTLLQFVRDVEARQERLRQTLHNCQGRREEGSLWIDSDAFLVRREDGKDEYLLGRGLLDADTIITVYDDRGFCKWANKNFADILGLPITDVIGKRADEIWPTTRPLVCDELEAQSQGPMLFRENLQVSGRILKRFSIRFALPAELRDYGAIAKINFDTSVVSRCPDEISADAWGRLRPAGGVAEARARNSGTADVNAPGRHEQARQTEAAKNIRLLQQLGESSRAIAVGACVSESIIRRILAPRRYVPRAETVQALSDLAARIAQQKFALMARHLQIDVFATCNHKGIELDERLRSELQKVMLDSLVQAVGHSEGGPDLPPGVDAAIATLGGGIYLIKMEEALGDVQKTQLLIHELEHLVDRLRNGVPRAVPMRPPKSAF